MVTLELVFETHTFFGSGNYYKAVSCLISHWFYFQTDDLQDHIIICGFGRVGQV